MFEKIFEFEKLLAEFTGAPFAISTDCCTHAIELCMRYEKVTKCEFSAFTYLSIPMTMKKLNIEYRLLDETWIGEYRFYNTKIWDSARLLKKNMYKKGMMQCLSFGYGKPVDIGRGGAILLDDENAYNTISKMRYDGRDLTISPWISQQKFTQGFHYKLNPEECSRASDALISYIKNEKYDSKYIEYPDCRSILID